MSNAGALVISVTGEPELMAKLNKDRMISAPARTFFLDAGAAAQQSAYEHAAKDTGRMSGEIYTVYDNSSPMSFFELIAPTPYAPYQEFGTWKMAAHPFMRPAMAETEASVHGVRLAGFSRAIERGMAI